MSRTSRKWRVELVGARMSLMWQILTASDRKNIGEWGLENPCVGGSIPPQATKYAPQYHKYCGVFICAVRD